MPDVLEMPYRPPLKGSGLPGEKPYTYRLSCNTCLAGDVIGEYSFDSQIRIGDRLYFEDMAIYSMVKPIPLTESHPFHRGDGQSWKLPNDKGVWI